MGVVAGLLAEEGHRFGDARACEGSDSPLRVALDVLRLPLPAGAKDVHYVTHSSKPVTTVSLTVALLAPSVYIDKRLNARDGSTTVFDFAVRLPNGYGKVPTMTDVLLTAAGNNP
ncbi:hypothetical protein ACGFY7_44025 [Streptomyces prunicolor]|uniref:hypothetical protein n=1 Tax=Streptomyces prunicolor TaxID=67348 RepID=UPI003710851C